MWLGRRFWIISRHFVAACAADCAVTAMAGLPTRRALSLANQYAHHAVSSVEQHFDGIDGFIDIIHADAVSELKQSGRAGSAGRAVLVAQCAGTGLLCAGCPPDPSSGLQPGNLTGLGQASRLDAAARHEMPWCWA
jgi:hypothetical protein